MSNAPALTLGIVLIGWAMYMRALAGTWLNPSAFFPLWWAFAGLIPLLVAPNELVGPHAVLWLISASIAFSAGATAGNIGFCTRLSSKVAPATDRELLLFGTVVVASVVLGMGSNIAFALGSNVSVGELFDIEKLIVVSNRLYVQRYDEIPPPPPLISQALLPFVFLGPAAGGVLFVLRRERLWKLVALTAFIPSIAVTVLQTTKAAVLFAMMLWLSGYFACRLRFRNLAVFTRGHFLVAAFFGTILTAFFFAVSFARMASTDASLLDLVMGKLLTSAFGHMTVFSQWLAEYWARPPDPSLGRIVFAGPLEMLGYGQRVPGVFENVIDLVIGETSNIYTAFRPLIEDFTIPGALAVMALLGFVGGVGFRLVAAGQWRGLPLLLIAYLTTMASPIAWFWIYNSLTASLIGVTVLILSTRLWRGRTAKGKFVETQARLV